MLKKHVLRSRVRVRDVASEWDVWAAWGKDYSEPQRQWRFGSQGAVEPVWERGISTWAGKDVHRIRDLRAVGMGHRILTPKDALRMSTRLFIGKLSDHGKQLMKQTPTKMEQRTIMPSIVSYAECQKVPSSYPELYPLIPIWI